MTSTVYRSGPAQDEAALGVPSGAKIPATDARIFELLSAWQERRNGRSVPYYRDFDPLQVPRLLPYLWLYRHEPAREDFFCRLAGEEVNAAWGRSIRGLALKQVIGEEDHPVVHRRWLDILEVPLIHYGSAAERLSEMRYRSAERLILPLAMECGTPSFILGISLYKISVPQTGEEPLGPEEITRIPCDQI